MAAQCFGSSTLGEVSTRVDERVLGGRAARSARVNFLLAGATHAPSGQSARRGLPKPGLRFLLDIASRRVTHRVTREGYHHRVKLSPGLCYSALKSTILGGPSTRVIESSLLLQTASRVQL